MIDYDFEKSYDEQEFDIKARIEMLCALETPILEEKEPAWHDERVTKQVYEAYGLHIERTYVYENPPQHASNGLIRNINYEVAST